MYVSSWSLSKKVYTTCSLYTQTGAKFKPIYFPETISYTVHDMLYLDVIANRVRPGDPAKFRPHTHTHTHTHTHQILVCDHTATLFLCHSHHYKPSG